MRGSGLIRLGMCTGLLLSLFTGLVATVSAQAATPASTQNPMMAQMATMQGAFPQGLASTLFTDMQANLSTQSTETPQATMAATESAMSTPMATMQMNMTPAATAMMGATAEATSMMGVTCLFGEFSGNAEVPPAAPNATGIVFVSIDPSTGNICYEEAIGGITLPATATHIHQGEAGVSGSVVVPFDIAPDATGMAASCVMATTALASQIASNPTDFYVNVHTSDFPNGAARAQLKMWNSSMMQGIANGMNNALMTPQATGSMMATTEATSSP